jgi:glycosyltransferase involved in cell wall biosynthesis
MRLAMLSWRYVGHPQGGGAEVLTHEILKRCAAKGWDVTVFTAAYPGSAATEVIDGVRVIRKGHQHTVHFEAWRWLRVRIADFDRIVDQVNTIAFLTPLYVRTPIRRLLIHQFAKGYWFRETRGVFRLIAPIGYLLEPWQTRLYRKTPAITISNSTRRELEALGVPVAGVIPMALSADPVSSLQDKAGPLRLVIIGRLTPAKFVEEGIEAFAAVQASDPHAQLDVVGSGDPAYKARLVRLASERRLNVTFHDRVSEARKYELLAAAHLHVFTSHREGWGLTVTEAAAVGTPTIAYDVSGVRDSVEDPRLLVPCGDHRGLAEKALMLRDDTDLYATVRREAWERSRRLSWDATAEKFMELAA